MDNAILRKKLNTFKSSKGVLSKVSDEVVLDLLRTWENWPGSSADLYRELGMSKMQMVTLLKKGKKLVKNGAVSESEFHELPSSVTGFVPESSTVSGNGCAIEISWDGGRLIRFREVDQLVDFMKKVAA